MKNLIVTLGLLLSLGAQGADIPAGQPGEAAEALAQKIQEKNGLLEFQTTGALSFTFMGKDEIFWDRGRNLVEVSWKGMVNHYKVQFSTENHSHALVFKNEKFLSSSHKELKKLVTEAYGKFVNDTFWLNPAFHFYSQGTHRELVQGNQLKVFYESGGVTPGDTYVYTVDDEGLITYINMWVSIIPIKGIGVIVSDHVTTKLGFTVAQSNQFDFTGFPNVRLSNLDTYYEYPVNEDRFSRLVEIRSF